MNVSRILTPKIRRLNQRFLRAILKEESEVKEIINKERENLILEFSDSVGVLEKLEENIKALKDKPAIHDLLINQKCAYFNKETILHLRAINNIEKEILDNNKDYKTAIERLTFSDESAFDMDKANIALKAEINLLKLSNDDLMRKFNEIKDVDTNNFKTIID
ncbi:hypothetical protein RGU77_02820 [Actimicrobium sp. CCI2.3]|uniref:hypothetical protein n=1 Tax=Actimicrobium sp. CCI2.3 TaxID=3048616 RepID=UPI002AB548FF|nr:hypothetical protein [Actimicrobium sp. CCI2.3]MDY7573228.1 hypothetical protein [Actimicrobium sp. CCI2.3]